MPWFLHRLKCYPQTEGCAHLSKRVTDEIINVTMTSKLEILHIIDIDNWNLVEVSARPCIRIWEQGEATCEEVWKVTEQEQETPSPIWSGSHSNAVKQPSCGLWQHILFLKRKSGLHARLSPPRRVPSQNCQPWQSFLRSSKYGSHVLQTDFKS